MIQYIHVLDAVNAVNGNKPANTPAVVKQLTQALELYKQRGEFDGTMASAYECLTLAEYELQDEDCLYEI